MSSLVPHTLADTPAVSILILVGFICYINKVSARFIWTEFWRVFLSYGPWLAWLTIFLLVPHTFANTPAVSILILVGFICYINKVSARFIWTEFWRVFLSYGPWLDWLTTRVLQFLPMVNSKLGFFWFLGHLAYEHFNNKACMALGRNLPWSLSAVQVCNLITHIIFVLSFNGILFCGSFSLFVFFIVCLLTTSACYWSGVLYQQVECCEIDHGELGRTFTCGILDLRNTCVSCYFHVFPQ